MTVIILSWLITSAGRLQLASQIISHMAFKYMSSQVSETIGGHNNNTCYYYYCYYYYFFFFFLFFFFFFLYGVTISVGYEFLSWLTTWQLTFGPFVFLLLSPIQLTRHCSLTFMRTIQSGSHARLNFAKPLSTYQHAQNHASNNMLVVNRISLLGGLRGDGEMVKTRARSILLLSNNEGRLVLIF